MKMIWWDHIWEVKQVDEGGSNLVSYNCNQIAGNSSEDTLLRMLFTTLTAKYFSLSEKYFFIHL